MLIVERQQRILEMLRQQKAAQLEELARRLDVSSSTVRRDLEALEDKGLVQRTHGGAIYVGSNDGGNGAAAEPTLALAARLSENVAQKQAIARYAAQLVQPEMTLLLDGGSTVVYTARQIQARPIQVVTSSLSIANLFASDEQVELIVLGGSLYPRTEVTVGPITVQCLENLHADLLLFSLASIYEDAAYNMNLAMAQVEQAMLRQAGRSLLLMDSSKFGRKSLARVCGLGDVSQVVTDSQIDPAWRERLGDRLVVAE